MFWIGRKEKAAKTGVTVKKEAFFVLLHLKSFQPREQKGHIKVVREETLRRRGRIAGIFSCWVDMSLLGRMPG